MAPDELLVTGAGGSSATAGAALGLEMGSTGASFLGKACLDIQDVSGCAAKRSTDLFRRNNEINK